MRFSFLQVPVLVVRSFVDLLLECQATDEDLAEVIEKLKDNEAR